MPRFPQKPHVCQWCRTGFVTYPELTKHHEDCKARPSKAPQQTQFCCPHQACDVSFSNFDSLLTHLNHCSLLSDARDFSDGLIFRDDIESELARVQREGDFQRWCRENGRDADAA